MKLFTSARGLAAVASFTALLALSGCAATTSVAATAPAAVAAPAATAAEVSHYAVFPHGLPAKDWHLLKSVRPTGAARDAVRAMDEQPALDWYSEYEGADHHPDITLSGNADSLGEERRVLTAHKGAVAEGTISGRQALWKAESVGGAFVAIDWADGYTVTLSSTDLPLDRLRDLARTVRPATEAEWVAAGGEFSACMPFDSDCVDAATAGK